MLMNTHTHTYTHTHTNSFLFLLALHRNLQVYKDQVRVFGIFCKLSKFSHGNASCRLII